MAVNKILNKLSHYHSWLVPIFILMAAIIIRVIYLNQIEVMATFDAPTMDEKYHLELVQSINSDEGLPKEPFFRAPLYPLFLASLFKITNDSFYQVRLIQLIIGSFLPLLMFLLGIKLFNRKIAFWLAVIAVFYPTFIYYDVSLLITFLIVLLSVLLVWQLYRCDGKSYVQFIIVGILLGIAGLARPNILLLGPVLFIWIWIIIKPLVGWKRSLIGYALIGITSFLIILPVSIRNYVVSGDFVLIAWQGGYNFFIGNNHRANGWSATVPGIDRSWKAGYIQSIATAEKQAGKKLKHSEVSDFWYNAAIDDIRKYPSVFISLLLKKFRLLINGYEIPNNQNIYIVRSFAGFIKPLMFNKLLYFPFGLLAPLALIGLVISLSQWRKYLLVYLFLFSYSVSLLLFFVCARFRQPLIPFLIFFAVFAIYKFIDYVKRKELKNIILFLFVFLLLLAECNHDMIHLNPRRLMAENHLMLGNAYREKNNLAKALTEFKKSVIADSSFARGYINIGVIHTRRSQYAEGAKYFRKALAINPTIPEIYFNLATCFLKDNNINAAIKILEEARRYFPINDYLHFKLGMTYYEAGRVNDAMQSLEKSLQLNPNNKTAVKVYNALINIPAEK